MIFLLRILQLACIFIVVYSGDSNVTTEPPLIKSSGDLDTTESRRSFYPDGPLYPQDGRLPMSDCDALVKDKEGWIFTPNYPSDYDNHRSCYYVIERYTSDTCRVEMTLNDFDLEESSNCLADYLDIRDAQQGVLCGSLATGTKKRLQFRSGQSTITMRFKSDGQNTRKGFMIQLKQIPRSCGSTETPRTNFCNRYIDTFTSTITSPGYPNGYAPNLRCAYTIRKADPRICKILLEFRHMDLGRNSAWPCRGDYLEFPDLTKFCETYPTRKILDFARGSDLMTFSFISDGYGSGQGFDIELLQVPDSCGGTVQPPIPGGQCDQEISTITGHFTSPRYPRPYGPNERCRYIIRKADPSICSVELDFRTFDVEYGGAVCNKDYLSLPNLSRLCGTVTGKQLIEIPEDSDSVSLYFLSDQRRQRKGFDIHVTQLFNTCSGPGSHGTCDQEIASYNGRFTSPGYPSPYPPNHRCTYTIRRADPSVCTVELDFRKFDLEFSRDQCSKDFLMLPDRSRFCGKSTGIQIVKFPIGSDIVALNFFSDSFGGGRGFDIGVTQRRNTCDRPIPDCNVEIASTAGRITSPGYPRYYTPGLRCQYKIRRPEPSTCSVELDFRVFDVASSAGCSEDYLELPDRTRLCGSQANSKILDYSSIGSDVITLTFVTDSIGAGRGFDIVVRQLPNSCGIIPPPPSCDVTVTKDMAIIHSPDYPEDYPNNALCVYTILKLDSSICQVKIEFLDFDVEESEDCLSDYLQLRKAGTKFCGVRLPPEKVLNFEPGSQELRMVFKSDSQTVRRGFEARVRQIKNSCYRPIGPETKVCGTYSNTISYIQSENFPLLYLPNTDCEYKIVRANSNICQLELYFSHFDIASDSNSPMCDRDYLEIKGARYCGKRDGQRILVDFPKSQNEVTLHFKTDSYDQQSGFRIEIKQLTSGCTPTPPTSCDQTFTGQTFQVISPGYQSGYYPESVECLYTIKKFDFKVCALEVKFYTFDVEKSDDCTKDYLEISEQKLCGRMEYDSVRTYQFLEDETVVKFHSDEFTEGAGFFLLFEQKEC